MFSASRRQIWTQQPQGAVEIDWSNPLTRGLTYATADGAGGADSSITSLGSVPKIADRWGKGDYFDGSSQKIAKNSLVGRSLDLTVCVLHKSTVLPPNGPTYCHVLASTTGASPADYYGWILMLGNGTGAPQFRVYQSPYGNHDAACDAAGAINDGKPHVTIATVFGEAGGAMTLDVDGKTVASSTHPANLYSWTNNLAIGKARHDFWGGFEGSIGAVFVFDRVLSAKERSSLSANPWQIFKRPDSRIFVPVSAGGGTTTVTSNSTASYKVQGSVQSSSVAAYGIRSAIQSDSAASYAIRAAIQQDAASAYSIRGSTQQSSTLAYGIRGLVDQAIASSYAIRSAISSDAAATYNILSATSVSSSTSAGYNIRGSVNQGSAASYALRGSITQDTAASYALRGSITQDTSATYSILSASSVSSSATAGYAIKGSVESSIVAGYSIAQAVQAEVAASYIIRSGVVSEAQAVFVKASGIYEQVSGVYVKQAGLYRQSVVFVKQSNAWIKL